MALQSLVILVVAAVVTALSALIAFPLLRRAGVVDVPSHRSSHTLSTVRGGGIAIGCGISGVPLSKWWKFFVPLFGILYVTQMLTVVFAQVFLGF